MWLCKNIKEKKGSKRWTSVPVVKTMGTRCPPLGIKKINKKIKIAHVFPKKFQ